MAKVMNVKNAADALQAQGFRVTPQRTMILECLLSADDHVTAENLFERVKERYPHLSFSTVYRTLELLRDSGLVTQTDLGGGNWRYHPVHKANHHHLICLGCGQMSQVPPELFSEVHAHLLGSYNFDAVMDHYAIYGWCEKCR